MKKINLHIGCGDVYIPGFIHIDVRYFPNLDYISPANNLYMFKNNSVDLIYSCCLLEHLKKDEAEQALEEWYRVLKKGGILRVSVPDFEKVTEVYQKYKDINLIQGLVHGRQDYKENVHYKSYDFKSLKSLLKENGFANIHRYDWRKTIHKDYDDYSQAYIPHMNKEKGTLMSLNIEAEK